VLPLKTPVAVAAQRVEQRGRRVQHGVDRRFNRARYDAEMVIAAFTARLRQTVDLDTVQGDLVGTVDAAFQPAHVSVWLPPGT
jgi:ribose 1,5-bisphosphokinase PhnN